ncbi:alcohol dehydrogenase [Pseudolabrys taiwanensis]|uniref:alcohol dehydrogenase n=1 Tax=Pseudolabrys taiwanensis TaxID=331696 RepID=A0A345ZYW4_9HYPH|nr:alcohol dehydrogenase [Pseudolabrys taiwanensis]AXK82111.1 alcohol dehydrogenase [Pseudolabrys taiwanensis]
MRMFQVCVCGEPLKLNEQPTPAPKGSEVLLKVLAAGVCHSDLHLADGWFDLGGGKRLSLQDRGMKLPVTLGHENVGEVVAVGPEAKGVKVGDRVLADPWIGCGTCAVCLRGEDNLCRAMKSLGVFSDGGYADYVMVPHPRYLFDIGDLDPARVAPLACSGVTTFGALKKVPTLKEEPTVIIGAGGLGLMCLALHQKMGGHSAIVVDIDPVKRAAAKKAGAAHVIDGGAPDASQQIIDLTKGGAWGVVDLVGSSQSARVGYDSLIKGGKYVIVGLYGGDLTVSLPPIPMRALTIQGSYVGSLHEMRELMELVRRTGLPDVPVATRPLDDVNTVMSDLRAGKIVGRVVLTPA